MTPDQTALWLEIEHRKMLALESIAASLQTMAGHSRKALDIPDLLHSSRHSIGLALMRWLINQTATALL
jgi:hypothetical protein